MKEFNAFINVVDISKQRQLQAGNNINKTGGAKLTNANLVTDNVKRI